MSVALHQISSLPRWAVREATCPSCSKPVPPARGHHICSAAQQKLRSSSNFCLQEGHQKKELAWPSAAAMAGMAALCLWRGFREDE